MLENKKINENKGITLIALAITIIVLIILAGISITTLTGEKGLVNQARNNSEEAQRESIIEKIEADLLKEKTKTGKIPSKADLKEIIQENKYNEGEVGEERFVTKDGGYTINYDEIIGWEEKVELKFEDLTWENGKANIAIYTNRTDLTLEYKIDNSEWNKTTSGEEIKEIENNKTIFARLTDDNEKVIEENYQKIEDKTPPVIKNAEVTFVKNSNVIKKSYTNKKIGAIEGKNIAIKAEVNDNETGILEPITLELKTQSGNKTMTCTSAELKKGANYYFTIDENIEVTIIATDKAGNIQKQSIKTE